MTESVCFKLCFCLRNCAFVYNGAAQRCAGSVGAGWQAEFSSLYNKVPRVPLSRPDPVNQSRSRCCDIGHFEVRKVVLKARSKRVTHTAHSYRFIPCYIGNNCIHSPAAVRRFHSSSRCSNAQSSQRGLVMVWVGNASVRVWRGLR